MRLKTFKNIDTMDTKDKINNIEDKNVDVKGNDASVGGVETTIQEPTEKEASIAATAVETAKEVANVAGAAVKGTVKTVGVFAKVMGFIFGKLPLLGAVVAVVVLGSLFVFNPFGWEGSLFGKPQIEKTENIVQEVKKIAEFTTACYCEESVIKDNKITTVASWWGNSVDTVNHEIVLTVKCKVRAGYDLSALREDDLVVKGDTIDIKLPAPKVFDVISNPSDYRIFEEIGDWGHDEIVALQKQGKEKMLQNALNSNILEKANKIGKDRVASLFAAFGFNVVNVTLSDIPVREQAPEVAPVAKAVVEQVEAPAVEATPVVDTVAVVVEEQVAA